MLAARLGVLPSALADEDPRDLVTLYHLYAHEGGSRGQ